MSRLEAPPAPPARETGTGTARPRRTRRTVAIVAAAVLLLAGGVLAVAHALDVAALSQVQVFLDAKPITCADPSDVTTVTGGDSFGGQSYRVPAVKGAVGLDCVLSVVIRNDSDRDVALQALTLPFFGPASAMGIRSDRAQTQQSVPTNVDDGRDVVYTWGSNPLIVLGAGDSFIYMVHLTSDGCRQAGSTFVSDAPIATVATGTATRDAPLEGPGFGVLGVKTSAQPCR